MPVQLIETRPSVLQSKKVPPEVLHVFPLHFGIGMVVEVDVDVRVVVVEDSEVRVLEVVVLVKVDVAVVDFVVVEDA